MLNKTFMYFQTLSKLESRGLKIKMKQTLNILRVSICSRIIITYIKAHPLPSTWASCN